MSMRVKIPFVNSSGKHCVQDPDHFSEWSLIQSLQFITTERAADEFRAVPVTPTFISCREICLSNFVGLLIVSINAAENQHFLSPENNN